MDKHTRFPLTPFPPTTAGSAWEILQRMKQTAFQGRNMGLAADIWTEMLSQPTTIFLGLSGALIPAGMREILTHLVQRRMVDCLVSTGANLFHDLYETLGRRHWQGTPDADDEELAQVGINRMYDVYASYAEIDQVDRLVTQFSNSLPSRPMSTREYLHRLGQWATEQGQQEGVLTTAAKADVPVYCPSIADSVLGMAIAAGKARGQSNLTLDPMLDVVEMARIVQASPASGMIALGGGVPRNFIQQAAVSGYFYGQEFPGHRYGIHITTDAPQWGGLSGSTFQEARSWKKYTADAHVVTVYAEATIALPLLVLAVSESCQHQIATRQKPRFSFEPELRILEPA
ncbi:MAG: deoxyhypusine synthase family protein [Chloroflexi bacterium]|nr:deoxyhypusine synthase family protein [Chloroflexota bacterium]